MEHKGKRVIKFTQIHTENNSNLFHKNKRIINLYQNPLSIPFRKQKTSTMNKKTNYLFNKTLVSEPLNNKNY